MLNSGSVRALFLQMDELLDAMDTRGPASTRYFLDLERGEITRELAHGAFEGSTASAVSEAGTRVPSDASAERREPIDHAVEIPRADREEERRQMRAFAATIGAPEAHAALTQALDGEEPVTGFRQTLTALPSVARAWRHERRQALLPVALRWLESHGVQAQFELRPLTPRRSTRTVAQRPNLLDLLLLGALDPVAAPQAAVEATAEPRRAGEIIRRFRARDEAHALLLREALAAEATRWLGEPESEPGGDLRFGRLRLRVRGFLVELLVAFTAADRARFAAEDEQELDAPA